MFCPRSKTKTPGLISVMDFGVIAAVSLMGGKSCDEIFPLGPSSGIAFFHSESSKPGLFHPGISSRAS